MPCSQECGGGKAFRGRQTEQPPINNGTECLPEDALDEMDCNIQPCPINCEWEEWAEWTPCPEECGNVHQFRHRDVKTQPQYGGDLCEGKGTENKTCDPIAEVLQKMADLKDQVEDLKTCQHCGAKTTSAPVEPEVMEEVNLGTVGVRVLDARTNKPVDGATVYITSYEKNLQDTLKTSKDKDVSTDMLNGLADGNSQIQIDVVKDGYEEFKLITKVSLAPIDTPDNKITVSLMPKTAPNAEIILSWVGDSDLDIFVRDSKDCVAGPSRSSKCGCGNENGTCSNIPHGDYMSSDMGGGSVGPPKERVTIGDTSLGPFAVWARINTYQVTANQATLKHALCEASPVFQVHPGDRYPSVTIGAPCDTYQGQQFWFAGCLKDDQGFGAKFFTNKGPKIFVDSAESALTSPLWSAKNACKNLE